MFFVINKSKVISYILAVCSVVMLFMLASSANNDVNTVTTSSNVIENTQNYFNEDINNSLESIVLNEMVLNTLNSTNETEDM